MSSDEYRLVMLGSGGVGKSALTMQLVTNKFVEDYDPSIENHYLKKVVVDNIPAVLDILDTAGQSEYSQMQDQWMRDGQTFILVYSVTDRKTFEQIKPLHLKLCRAQDADRVPMILAGNKCDMEPQRKVRTEEGLALAKELGCPFLETSAKDLINHEECFYETVRELKVKWHLPLNRLTAQLVLRFLTSTLQITRTSTGCSPQKQTQLRLRFCRDARQPRSQDYRTCRAGTATSPLSVRLIVIVGPEIPTA